MMKDKIKNYIENKKSEKQIFKYRGTRKQSECFNGRIIEIYNSIFIVKVDNSSILKSFSYSDILIGNLIIMQKTL